jgi:diguanylate cyclase (GGDEF)-like protein
VNLGASFPGQSGVSVWEKVSDRALRALHIRSLSGKFLAFGVAATLISALAMTMLLYGRNRRALTDRADLELRGLSSEIARETDAWFDQRLVDLRLRASPYVVSDNLARASGRNGEKALVRLHDYLNSLRQNLPAHDGLAIVSPEGQVLTSSGSRAGFRLSQDQLNNLRARDALVGDAFWDSGLGKAEMVIVVPIRRDDGALLGALSAKVNLDSLRNMLAQLSSDRTGPQAYLITDQGRLVVSSTGSSADLMKATLPPQTTRELFEREGQIVSQSRSGNEDVLAMLRRIPQLHWAVVAEVPRARAAAGSGLGSTILLIAVLVLGLGAVAFVIGVAINRPLTRLTDAAARVAAGDLSSELPIAGSGEVGYLTRAFNTLVSRLREKESQGELEKLSLTDALTGLYNRRHLMGTLASEVQRSRRLRRSFTVMLADVDRFKQHNDTHGHLAGDAALVKIAEVFRRTTRAVDCVARYGGEEFVVMLLECTMATATLVAERVRARVAEQDLGEGKLTVSIGLAEYPEGGETPEELIATADAAMYQAKTSGRNQVVVAGATTLAEAGQARSPERKNRRRKEA